ncbi:fungal-specific transcription factor domain-containing protein [Leptodontidium sp. 2 PMI_412]|nr:fungal-specific transcription factor domain-containing protein [Leptodontidium sp. 2 PMI_412]
MEEHLMYPKPSSIGACSRCRTRKVKCDGSVPQCAACTKHNTSCDITDHVFYSYETVQRLQATIHQHEQRQSTNVPVTATLSSQHSPIHQGIEPLSVQRPVSVIIDNALSSVGRLPQALNNSGNDLATIETLAEEVGSLALGQQSSQQYIGSAAGSSFCRIFFHQLNLASEETLGHIGSNFRQADPFSTKASLPPKPVAMLLLSIYITRVHMWRPIFNLKDLRSWFQQAYLSPKSCDAFKKFSIFLVLAIGSYKAEEKEAYRKLMDIHSPAEYFTTSMIFFDEVSACNNLQCLQSTLLLALWLSRVSNFANNTHLWQISRFAMSLAIELGCHRNNPRWEIGSSERELRNRIWWCTYDLERSVAVSTGRVLSIRNQAIDAPFPKLVDDDVLIESERIISPTFATKGFSPAIHMFRLRNITGDILESIYIARPRAGHHPSIQDTVVVADSIRERLARWHSVLDECAVSESRERLEMRLELCLAVILLNRPSPSFPSPMDSAVEACADACQTAIQTWKVLLDRNELGISWKSFHDVFMTGLVWLYCAWKLSIFDENSVEHFATACISILEYIDRTAGRSSRYIQFYGRIKAITIKRFRSQDGAMIQRANSDLEFDHLGFDWMDECFNELFTGASDSFALDFKMNEDIFEVPTHLQDMHSR